MDKATMRFWTAYEKAVDMKIASVMKKVTPFKAKNEDSYREMVYRRCEKSFQYIDEHINSFKVIAIMIENADIDGFPTNEVYDLYCHYCNNLNFKLIKKEYFTKFVCDYFEYISARESSLNQMKLDALNATAERQAEIDALQAKAATEGQSSMYDAFDGMASSLDTIAGNTGDISDSVAITEEDLKYMRDLTERDVINRYTTAEIRVDMGGITQNISKDTDIDGVINKLTESIGEAIASTAEGVHF